MNSDEFRAARARLGLTQSAFAERLGMAPNSVARMERGERPVTARTAAAVALLLNTPAKRRRPLARKRGRA